MNVLPARRPLGLRARLTILYASTFVLLLVGVGWLFRQTLRSILQRDVEALLAEEWAAAKGYLDLREGRVGWAYDRTDPEVARVVQNVQSVFLLAHADGGTLQISDVFRDLNISADEIRRWGESSHPEDRLRRDRQGALYLLRTGQHVAEQRTYILSVGRSLESNERVVAQFTQTYLTGMPILVFGVAALGWIMAGRALSPLKEVARAARAFSSENLGVRLEHRGARDELDELIGAFNSMAGRLESSFNQARRFSVDASHELRTPLTAIRSQLEVALITARTTEHYRDAVVAAIDGADQLTQVIKALMHLSQAESGQVAIARETVNLRDLVAKVAEQFQFPAETQEIRLETSLEDCSIIGDPVQLQRMISNLLANALKYTPPGGRVSVEVDRRGPGVALVVADTGRGIAAEHLPHIFDRFYRVPDASTSPERGLGLGLSFVNWIAKVHSAQVAVESTVGAGTRFTVSFPEAVSEARPAPSQASVAGM